MTCLFCKGDMEKSFTTYFSELNNCMVIIKNVPCFKCTQCGETVFSGTVVKRIEDILDKIENSITEVAIVNYSDKVA